MVDTDVFIEQLITKALPDLDKEDLATMIEDTKPVLYDRVMSHIVKQIDEKDGDKFFDILETQGVTQEVADYLKSKIPDFQKFLDKIYTDFETMYLKEIEDFEEQFGDEGFEDDEEKK